MEKTVILHTGRRLNHRIERLATEEERVAEFRTAAGEIESLCSVADGARDTAIAAVHSALDARLRLAVKLQEFRQRFAGEFDAWLDGYCAEFVSRATAYRWLAKLRDLKVALGKEDPTFEELKRAQIAAQILPEPLGNNSGGNVDPPPFRLRFEVPSNLPPEKWEPGIRREFIAQAKPIVDAYQRAVALEESA